MAPSVLRLRRLRSGAESNTGSARRHQICLFGEHSTARHRRLVHRRSKPLTACPRKGGDRDECVGPIEKSRRDGQRPFSASPSTFGPRLFGPPNIWTHSVCHSSRFVCSPAALPAKVVAARRPFSLLEGGPTATRPTGRSKSFSGPPGFVDRVVLGLFVDFHFSGHAREGRNPAAGECVEDLSRPGRFRSTKPTRSSNRSRANRPLNPHR